MALPLAVPHPRDMATEPTVARTVRYLRFPLSPDHRARLQDGSSCPYCDGKHVHKWGRCSSGQRYRCCDCGRTFSTFTGTPLYYLKHPDRWRLFLWCVDGRLTVRRSAALLDVDKNTALRWRHRLLDQWRKEPRAKLKGRIVIGDFCIPHSAKGSRSLSRPARRHGEDWTFRFLQTDPVTVLVAWERPSAMVIETLRRPGLSNQDRGGAREPLRGVTREDYERFLSRRTRKVAQIVGFRGPICTLASYARDVGATYCQEPRSFYPTEVMWVRRDLRAWLRPFRGVSTRRLDNYLEWFRRRGTPASQQFPQTERDGGGASGDTAPGQPP